MARIYRYVHVNDGGMAPNPRDGLLTLATCKPSIRIRAEPGDWVLGCYPSPLNQLLSWAGKIALSLDPAEYSARFPKRADALYNRNEKGELVRIPGKMTWYHPTEKQRQKDKKGNVLLFEPEASWYFGDEGRQTPTALMHLVARGQGHRVNGTNAGDDQKLLAWLQAEGPPSLTARPRHGWENSKASGCGKKPPLIRPRC